MLINNDENLWNHPSRITQGVEEGACSKYSMAALITRNAEKGQYVSNFELYLITFEHDKYKEKKNYDAMAREFLLPKGYKIGIENVYSNFKKNKIFETWFLREDINYSPKSYDEWLKIKKNFFNFL